jgi:hypothetical protein
VVQLPGEDLVQRGLEDLAVGVESVESLLVSIGAPRLAALGLPVEGVSLAGAPAVCTARRPGL